MKKLFILFFGIAGIAHGSDVQLLLSTNSIIAARKSIEAYKGALAEGYFTITTNEEADIKRKLDAYDQGKLTIEDLNEKAGQEGNRELMSYYILHANDIPTKAKLPISRSFSFASVYPQATYLAEKYVNVYSNDSRAWGALGIDYLYMNALGYMNDPGKVISAFSNAVRLGNTNIVVPLATIALLWNRMDVAGKVMPQVLKLYQSNKVEDRLGTASVLISYSLKAKRKDIFVKTLKGEDLGVFLRDEDLKKEIAFGCNTFKGTDIDKIRKMASEAELKDTSSVTNKF
ncbi:MAG: hypothetical protein ACREDS_05475 [Limisphaerales bacterium]